MMSLLSRLKSSPARESEKKESWWDSIRTTGYAIALALVFRSLLFEPFHIPSGSMRSTLLEGDYIFVSKFSYGYSRYSFPFGARLDYFSDRLAGEMPKRGDVLVFRLPTDTTTDYIKRVIGLPGDSIKVADGKVYINGEMLEYERVDDFVYREDRDPRPVFRYRETLPNGVQHLVLDETAYGEVDYTQDYVVPQGHLFMMGDNRDNSIDSRYLNHVGFVPVENVVGRADLILFSLRKGHDVPFWKLWEYPAMFRGDRFFTSVNG